MDALIVARDPRARGWIRAALGSSWRCREAPDGLEGLRAARRAPKVRLVIADETTEPYGAFGFSRELKQIPDPPAVIVLLDRAHDGWLASWSGADRWLLKPADPFDLARAAGELTGAAPAVPARAPQEPTPAERAGSDAATQ